MATPTIGRSGSSRSTRSTEHDALLARYAAAKERHGAGLQQIVHASRALGAPYGEQHQREAIDLLRAQLHRQIDQALDAELAQLPQPRRRGHLLLARSGGGT